MLVTTKEQAKKIFKFGIDKLEIGSGANPEKSYIHLDIQRDLPDLDILADVRHMPLPVNFVSGEIRAVHIMEHFCHPEFAGKSMQKKYGTTLEIVKECYRVLKPGGKLRIVTPDYEKISESVAKKRIPMDWLQRWSVGGHDNEYDVHHWLWTKNDAKQWFTEAGFHHLHDWNPIQGWRTMMLNWNARDFRSRDWFDIEWYHWLFFEGTK
jgi:predicted SAM-dependent methyltransferase